ncbi:hypothetical protein ACFYO1_02100 [Nocardia sp. NPDC006044]|uniref:hypothetical protein n=1 Tax=Nocardia sp. NPDC006044 TaxID=3364306 RepID=UPI003674B9D8
MVGLAVALAVALVVAAALFFGYRTAPVAMSVCPGDEVSSAPEWTPSSTDANATYDRHPMVGNGYLGLRVPPRGMGYFSADELSGWPLYTPRYDGAFVAGLYGKKAGVADGREVAAALPVWSTLDLDVDGETFTSGTPSTQISNFKQTLYLRCGLVRTTFTWTTPTGKAADLTYEVVTDRSDQHVGAVHLTLVPRWSGDITVIDLLDGSGARRVSGTDSEVANDDMRLGFRTEGPESQARLSLYCGQAWRRLSTLRRFVI